MADDVHTTRLMAALACKSNEIPKQRFVIPVFDREGKLIATLACVDRELASDMEIVADLTAWRQRYMHYFLTQFEATVSRTKEWLENIVIPSPDRMFFIIYLTTGEAIGNFGICKMTAFSGELDNIIRGKKLDTSELIYYCALSLLSWMFGHLGYLTSSLHVFSNNQPAIRLYLSIGFSVLNIIQLTRRSLPDLQRFQHQRVT